MSGLEFAIRKLKSKLTRTVETLMQIKKKSLWANKNTIGPLYFGGLVQLLTLGLIAARRLVGITPMIVLQRLLLMDGTLPSFTLMITYHKLQPSAFFWV